METGQRSERRLELLLASVISVTVCIRVPHISYETPYQPYQDGYRSGLPCRGGILQECYPNMPAVARTFSP
jgi:hypothetical protein